jgi:hypothetical protein
MTVLKEAPTKTRMSSKLSGYLIKTFSFTEEQIKGLEDKGVRSNFDMEYITKEDLIELGVIDSIAPQVIEEFHGRYKKFLN